MVTKKSNKTVAYIARFSSLLRLTLSNSREDFVLLEDEIQSLNDYLALQSDFGNTFKYDISCEDLINPQNTFVPPPMFIQPSIENSIQHGLRNSQNGLINVWFSIMEEGKNIECIITDNGIGPSQSKQMDNSLPWGKSKSVSTEIVRERLKIYQKKFKIPTALNIEKGKNND